MQTTGGDVIKNRKGKRFTGGGGVWGGGGGGEGGVGGGGGIGVVGEFLSTPWAVS